MVGTTRWATGALLGALGAAAGCAGPTVDPLGAVTAHATPWPARAIAALPGQVALAYQFHDEVELVALAGGGQPATAAVGVGPLAIAALGPGALVTANPGDGSLSFLAAEGGGLVHGASVTLAAPPTAVAAADLDGDGASDALVAVGLGDGDDGVEGWRAAASPAPIGTRWAVPGVFAVAAGDVDGDGDVDAVAVVPGIDQIAWAANDGHGQLTEAGRATVCHAPRAAAVVGGRIAVACPGGLALVDGGVVSRLPYDGNLYDLVAADLDGDGQDDLAAVDLDHAAVVVWLARGDGFAAPSSAAVDLGPVGLRAADLDGDGDLDLAVLAYQAWTLDVVENSTVRSSP